MPSPTATTDLEMNPIRGNCWPNNSVSTFGWHKVNVVAKHKTGHSLPILTDSCGVARAGEMLAIMGPSGSGKTTLLNVLAHRVAANGATKEGDVFVNGSKASLQMIRDLSSYVEQENSLIGSLTVKETMLFAARLSVTASARMDETYRRIDELIDSFGLQSQANVAVGGHTKKGLSGGQKKRLAIASRLITNPRILFLDEPTSGLDSALSFEVCSYLRDMAKKNNLIIVASIHQPSSAAFQQFDSLCLLSGGRTCYFGPVSHSTAYFSRIGHPIPPQINAAEFFLDLINTDLDKGGEIASRTDGICQSWASSDLRIRLQQTIDGLKDISVVDTPHHKTARPRPWVVLGILLHRSWIKSYRDAMVYGVRVAMYLGLAVLMGTVFLQFEAEQRYVLPYIYAIFFAGAFMSFMAVAYVPAFLEDLSTFEQERANGLVGPLTFITSNFVIGLPFLFSISVLFSVVGYWLMGFRAIGSAFCKWVLWIFLELVAAESLVVFVSATFNIFVIALAVTAFANAVWMCVAGALVPLTILNPFWEKIFHHIDYQAYAFQGMMVNEFEHREYKCAQSSEGQYQCSYPSDLNSVGRFRGTDVLDEFGIRTGLEGTWIGIMMGIIISYRVLAYVSLVLR